MLDSIQSREFNEDYFDVSMSGTTATLVIQLPDKLIMGWVGNSQITEHYIDIRKKQVDQFITSDLDENGEKSSIPLHSPYNQQERIRVYSKKGEIKDCAIDEC